MAPEDRIRQLEVDRIERALMVAIFDKDDEDKDDEDDNTYEDDNVYVGSIAKALYSIGVKVE